MKTTAAIPERRTSADIVFEHLYDKIMTLDVMPGARISEAEMADLFGVSRQPVRDAFNRLGNMNLLLIQPQRATTVRKFSTVEIQSARFIRLAVELEIARAAARRWQPDFAPRFHEILDKQAAAVGEDDTRGFHGLDHAFHELIADVAQQPIAFELVRDNKALIDRICVLSLKRSDEMAKLVDDHRAIFDALADGRLEDLEAALRLHLSRIEATIETVRREHGEYFEE